MVFSWRRFLFSAVSLASLLPLAIRVPAQGTGEPKPAVVVSLASIDEVMADIDYLSRAAGTPELGGVAKVVASQYIEGVDQKKPSGAYVTFDNGAPSVVAFIPVSDFSRVLTVLKRNVGEPEPAGGGVLKFSLNREIFLKERGGWVFISDSATKLVNLPPDPAKTLGGLYETYNLAIRVNVQNIPKELRNTALSEMRASFERRMKEESNGDTDRESQEKIARSMLKSATSLIEDSEQVTLGWAVDATQKATYLDLSATAVKGSDLAKQMAAMAHTRSSFTGFSMPDAAATLNFASTITPEEIQQTKGVLVTVRDSAMKEIDKDKDIDSPEAKASIKEAVDLLFTALQKTVESGRLDAGAAVVLNPGSAKFVFGGYVADTTSAEKAVRKLVEAAEREPDFPGVKFDADKHGAVRFHTMTVPISNDDAEAKKIFGNELDVALGIGEKSLYLAVGRESLPTLKKAIDASSANGDKQVLPLQFTLSLAAIFEFAASVENNPVVSQLAKTLRNSKGRDHIIVTAKPITDGVAYRLEVEDGILQAVGQAAKLQQGGR